MENSSNMSDPSDKVKGILTSMKSPLKHNLSKINDILDLFDKSTIALLNPIKKLKISAASKFEDLMELEKKVEEADKLNGTKGETCTKEANNIEETKEPKDYEKYAQIVEDFTNKICILNELLNTEEFKQLTNFSSNLNSNKKKANKDTSTLNLNKNDANNINGFNPIKSLKSKSSSNIAKKREIELSPNPEHNSGEKNVFDDIFNNEENESLTKSYNSDFENELNLKESSKKNNFNVSSSNNKNDSSAKAATAAKNKKPGSKSSKQSSNKIVNAKTKGFRNGTLLKKKTKRSTNSALVNNSKTKAKANNSSKKLGSSSNNNSTKTVKRPNETNNNININAFDNAKSPDSSGEVENINVIRKKEREQKENDSDEEKDKDENTPGRRLTDEECLEKMKEKLPNDKGLTKTFITRKLRKKVMVTRALDYTRFEATVKNVENSIPKKSGPNNFIKFSVKTSSEEDLKMNHNLLYFLKDLFITNFVVFKNKENVKKIIIAGSINKDIIHFLKRIATLEFKEKYHVLSAKVKAYAFYEELVHEFTQRKDVVSKNLTNDDIDGLIKQYEYLTHMRNCYEEIKKIRIVE